MKNKKGFMSIEVIFVMCVVLYGFVLLFTNYRNASNNMLLAEELSKEYIALVEEENYISPNVKAKIATDLNNLFSEVEIDGTLEPVEEGKKVHLIMKVANKNLRGGYIAKKTFVLEGVAK